MKYSRERVSNDMRVVRNHMLSMTEKGHKHMLFREIVAEMEDNPFVTRHLTDGQIRYALEKLIEQGEVKRWGNRSRRLYTYAPENAPNIAAHPATPTNPPSFCLQPSQTQGEQRFKEGYFVRRIDGTQPERGMVVKIGETITVAWPGCRLPFDYALNTVLLEPIPEAIPGQGVEKSLTLSADAGTVRITYTGSLRIEPA